MSPTRIRRVLAGVVLPALLTASGCIGKSSLSSYARTGDTVTVAFGAESAPGAWRREDLRAEIKDVNNVTRAVKVRAVINVYADPTSPVGSEKGDPFDTVGMRTAVIDLVDPTSGNPPPLAVGPAKLTLKRLSDSGVVAADVEIAILFGVGTINLLQEQLFGGSYVEALQPRPQVRYRIKPNLATYNQPLGAVEFELRFPASALVGRPETSWPQAIQTASDQNLRFSTRYFAEGSQQVIKVLMVNPDGMLNSGLSADLGYRGMSAYSSLRFAVAWGSAMRQTTYPPDTFDRNVIIAGPTVLRVFDTAGTDVSANFYLERE